MPRPASLPSKQIQDYAPFVGQEAIDELRELGARLHGLRALVLEQTFRGDHMVRAALLNVLYVAAAYGLFHHLLESARRNGALVQMGE